MSWTNEGGRIANATRVWQAAEDAPVTNWNKGNQFIIALAIGCTTHNGDEAVAACKWRKQGGTFAPLNETGAMKQSTETDLVNGDDVVEAEKGCSSDLTWNDTLAGEIEGCDDVLVNIPQNYWEEIQVAVDPADAEAGATYEFEVYIDGKDLDAVGAALTIASEVPAYYHGLKVQGAGELALCDVGSHPLRMRKGGTTYGVELVDTGDPNASPVRIKTPAGVKAVRNYT